MADTPGTGYFNVHKYADQASDGATGPVGSNYVSPSDVLADPESGQALVVSFKHEPSGQSVFFKAFVSTLNESYSSDWTEEVVFGRTDPIQLFKQTTRRITLGLKVPAETVGEAYDNLGRISSLTQFLYPNYASAGYAQTIAQGPVLRLKVMNLIQKGTGAPKPPEPKDGEQPAPNAAFKTYKSSADSSQGLMGVITSLSINHNLESTDIGVFTHQSNTVFSSMIEVNVDFTVLHESTLGWNGDSFTQPLFPYGVKPMSVDAAAAASARLGASRTQDPDDPDAARNEQQRQAALRRYATMGGKARLKKDLIWMNKMQNKDEADLTERQKANMEYLKQTIGGVAGVAAHDVDLSGDMSKKDMRSWGSDRHEELIDSR
jgi:hypothetical protein